MAAEFETGSRTIVAFTLGAEEFGIPIEQVLEIDRFSPVTRVPRVAPFIEGVINLRGQLLPIVDLRTRFGMERSDRTRKTRIVVAECKGHRIGLIVDEVSEVVRVPIDQIEGNPPLLAGAAADCVRSVAKLDDRLILLLELAEVVEGGGAVFEGPVAGAANDQR